jgi:Alkylmercury lyase
MDHGADTGSYGMTANRSPQQAALEELGVRLARVGLPAAGVQARHDALPAPLRAFHRRLLGAFLTEAGPPDPAAVAGLAAELDLDVGTALAELAAADVVLTDPATGAIAVAYPFSGRPTPHRVRLTGGAAVHAMCALDALGIPQMTGRDGLVHSTDPVSGQQITADVRRRAWRWQPATAVVLAATAADGGCVADCCCPHINFHATAQHAQTYLAAHPGMAGEVLGQAEAVQAAGRVFGGLLEPTTVR